MASSFRQPTRKVFKLSNHTSRYICKCIRIRCLLCLFFGPVNIINFISSCLLKRQVGGGGEFATDTDLAFFFFFDGCRDQQR